MEFSDFVLTTPSRRLILTQEGVVSVLVFTCPKSGQDIVSGINTDSTSLSRVGQLPVNVFCPKCGQVHRLTAKAGRLCEPIRPAAEIAHATR